MFSEGKLTVCGNGHAFVPSALLLPGSHRRIEDQKGSGSLESCVCQLLLNSSETSCFQLNGMYYPRNLSIWYKNPLDGPFGEMNWNNCSFQDSGASNISLSGPTQLLCWENITTLKPESKTIGLSSLGTAVTALSGSIGVVALILLLVGLLSMTLKKWRRERLFKKQLKHQTSFLHKSSDLSCHADAIYANVIHLAPWKEDAFAVYANVPRFDRPRKTSPDQVEYASIVFH
ncbi:hypothetical protein TREES_T100003437 [Tupaia chinensis]|uniref:Uncharacterized protein n=1 Tax=Tupaia chinensis TaxID=246437 RepID=L9JBR6_TUPCH|nr:hypothetical protein TREES_T100003437 [Tupaia chinensis]